MFFFNEAFGAPAATSAPLGGFGAFGCSQPTTTAPTLGGFGGFGTNTTATSVAPSLFATAAQGATSFGGQAMAAPFGGFGSTAASSAGGFGGFGTTATISTAPAFGGFGTQNTGLNAFSSGFNTGIGK